MREIEDSVKDIKENLSVSDNEKECHKENFFKRDIQKNSFLSKCIVCPREELSQQDKKSFHNQEYLSVKMKEEIILYRVTSEKEYKDKEEKIHKGRFASPYPPFDKLSAKTDLALSYPFGNRMEIVEEIKVPIGEILQVGYVAPKTTQGEDVLEIIKEQGNILQGIAVQVILPVDWYERKGWEILKSYPLENKSNYHEWEMKVKQYEKESVDKRVKI